jgi:SAM-dependent methyltransferase
MNHGQVFMANMPEKIEDRQREILPWLICPLTRAQFGKEAPLICADSVLTSVTGANRYPVVSGVPNLRLPFDQQSITTYDDILPDFSTNSPIRDTVLKAIGLSEDDFRGARVLLAGTAQGIDIDWILSLNPSKLVCLDYSSHVIEVAKRKSDKRLAFAVGDVCDLPFFTGTFDIVLSLGIIQHTRSPELAFDEKVRVLRPSGILTIGNLYSKNLHNHRISMFRHKYRIHEMPREDAKRFLRVNAVIYTLLCRTGLWRLHRRFLLPFILHYSNTGNKDYKFHYANAEDYYMPAYRHLTSADEVLFWANRLGAKVELTKKGFLVTKQ